MRGTMAPRIAQAVRLLYSVVTTIEEVASLSFRGFYPDTFGFLAGLVHNNEKAWFEAHKDDYRRLVVEPALAFITEMDAVVRSVSPHYRGVAKKAGGSLMRIYRDVRFGHDKTPYKTNVGIQFRHLRAADVHAPGWYVHLSLEECFVGAGTWRPEPGDLMSIRRLLAAQPGAYCEAVSAASRRGLIPAGDSAVRTPRGFDPDHPAVSEIKRKDFLVSAPLAPELFFGPGLVSELKTSFEASSAYMAWLCQALDIEF